MNNIKLRVNVEQCNRGETHMELQEIVLSVLGIVVTGLLGWLAYFIKGTLDEFKCGIRELENKIEESKQETEERNKGQDKKIEEVKQELSNLKADLPLLYVTREDNIRALNNVDRTINNMDSKLDKIYERMMRGGQ